MTKKRDIHIDILRCVGLFLVILAHIPINENIKAIRSFDVILLVFVAGISFVKSGKSRDHFAYKKYVIGRIKRLCIPTWITIGVIFLLAAILCILVKREYIYSFQQMFESIFFIGGINGGIGNVWIVRIYMLMAFLTPIFIIVDKRIRNNWTLIMLFLGGLIINELIVYCFYSEGTFQGLVIENFISSSICYSIAFIMGMKAERDYRGTFIKSVLVVFLPLFVLNQIILLQFGYGFDPNIFKYPPRMYYCIYGIIGTLVVYCICEKINIKNEKLIKYIIWISIKSFDIYLAHTLILKLISWGDAYLNNIFIFKVGILYYLVVLTSSILLVYFIDKFLNYVKEKKQCSIY